MTPKGSRPQSPRPSASLTPRERAIEALELRPPSPGLVPTFELEFQLTQEKFGREFFFRPDFENEPDPSRRRAMYDHNIDLYLDIARTYDYCAIVPIHGYYGQPDHDETIRFLERLRDKGGDRYLIVPHVGATMAIPDGNNMMEVVSEIADHPDALKAKYAALVQEKLQLAERLAGHGVDSFAECCDYCFNHGPFLSPAMFAEFVTPYLADLVAGLRQRGYYVIKHTDGNIMPILDQLVACRPHALHSLDPMAGVDIAEVKRLVGKEVCLIGNVNAALMQTGSDAQVRASAEYALRSGMPDGGYIFSTSNCAFKGLPLQRYELIMKVRQELGWYS